MKSLPAFAFLALLIVVSCTSMNRKPVTIALSAANANYVAWMRQTDSSMIIHDLRSMPVDSALEIMKHCDGLLLCGGEDVEPAYYGKTADSARCEMNPSRDTLEMALLEYAFQKKMPVLGICRGLQLINVALGGTLVVDIPADRPSDIAHRCDDYMKCFHLVRTVEESVLYRITKADSTPVTSNHHQGIEKIAPPLKISAFAPDGLPEAIEWSDPESKSFLLAVQWHPERMDMTNPLCGPLARTFVQSAIMYKTIQKH